MKIAVLGAWHQGVVGAACLAEMGYDVMGADSDTSRVDILNRGRAPLFEPGLDALLEKGVAAGKLKFTGDFAEAARGAPFIFIMFDTPVNEKDESDLSEIFSTFETVAPALEPGAVILVTAQVPVGTCDKLLAIANSCGGTACIAYIPENLRLGQAIERFRLMPLPVIGCDDPATFDRALTVLAPLAGKWKHVSLRTGEMVKHALNAFLALQICFANELGNICDEIGADGKLVGESLRLEPRVGATAMLLPGLGFSGGTLARDMQTLRGLARACHIDTPLLNGAWQANVEQNGLVLRKLSRLLPNLAAARIAVLGLTYKPDTSTLRRSAAMEVIAGLIAAGATVTAHDPKVLPDDVSAESKCILCETPMVAARDADALVLMTPWKDYKDLDFSAIKTAMAGNYVLDTAGLWSAESVTATGLNYDEIGRGRQRK